ncbi:hypothetical protein ACFPRL_24990 [Pseudoclavibacter helvolus]
MPRAQHGTRPLQRLPPSGHVDGDLRKRREVAARQRQAPDLVAAHSATPFASAVSAARSAMRFS